MKRKLLLTVLMVSLFACFLAISVGAKDISTGYYDLDGNEIVVPTYDEDGDSLVWILSTLLDRAQNYGIELSNGKTYYETSNEGKTYYIFGSKTKNTITVDSNYSFQFKSGIGIDNNIIVMNLDDIAHSDGTGVKYFGILIRNNVLQYLYIPSSIVSMKCKANGKSVLLGDSNLTQVEFETGSQMTVLESYSFESCGIEEIVLPDGLTSIGEEAFLNCKSLRTVYIPKTVTSIDKTAFNGVSAEYYFTGTEEAASGWQIADKIQYVNHCDAYYDGVHLYKDDGDCTTKLECERCSLVIKAAKEAHDNQLVVAYENGFAFSGVKRDGCVNCNAYTEEILDALFTFRGFSAAEYADGGMSIGFTVNSEAISRYEDITGKTVSYGVFAVLKEKIGDNDIFNKDGKAVNEAITADITDCGFDIFNLKIIGFTSEQVDDKIAMGAFVATTLGDATEYEYMQGEAPSKNEKYFFASYNDVVAIVNKK